MKMNILLIWSAYNEPIHDLENLLYQNNHRVGNIYPNAHIYDSSHQCNNCMRKNFRIIKYTTKKNLIIMEWMCFQSCCK